MQSGTLPPPQQSEQRQPARAWPRRLYDTLASDWQGTRLLCCGLVLLVAAALIVAAYYINHPTPETNPDTHTYLRVAQRILNGGDPVDPTRTPGYPLFVALLWLVGGSGNLQIVSIAQGCLFVLAVLECYLIAWMIWKRSWLGLVAGLVVASNLYLLSYVKPVAVEGFSLWLVTTLALAAIWYLQRVSARRLWLVAALLLLVFMTRPEWAYFPALLLGYLLFMAARRGQFRRLLPHALAALVVLYGLLGLFIYENSVQYGFTGITYIQNVNLLGKVLQYHMQNDAPPQYAAVAKQLDVILTYPKARGLDPYLVEPYYPALGQHYWSLAGSFSLAVIKAHPLEFALKSAPAVVALPTDYSYSKLLVNGPFGWELYQIERVAHLLYKVEITFLLWAVVWVALLCWRRTTRLPMVEAAGALVLIVLYQLVIDALGVYVDPRRFRAPIEPLLTLVVWGSVLWALSWGWQRYRARQRAASVSLAQAT